jgi:methylmalonyl-CoA mutase cobalamin-binding subunit
VRSFVAAALRENWNEAIDLTLQFLALTRSHVTVITDLFHAAQSHIEDRWHSGSATARDEYRVYRAIELSLSALPDPSPPTETENAPSALLVTVHPEEHDLGCRLVAVALREAGWAVEVRTMTSRPDLAARLAHQRFTLVGISSTFISRGRQELEAIVADVHRLGMPLIAGGSAFTRFSPLGQQLGVDIVAADARLAVALAGRLARGVRRQVREAS